MLTRTIIPQLTSINFNDLIFEFFKYSPVVFSGQETIFEECISNILINTEIETFQFKKIISY